MKVETQTRIAGLVLLAVGFLGMSAGLIWSLQGALTSAQEIIITAGSVTGMMFGLIMAVFPDLPAEGDPQ